MQKPLLHKTTCAVSPARAISTHSSHVQVIHLIRHGEGFHNIGIANEDAHLTEVGWRQAEALNRHMQSVKPLLDVQVCPAGGTSVVCFYHVEGPLVRQRLQGSCSTTWD